MDHAGSESRPMVLIIRHPDEETRVVTHGDVDYEVIDLGSSYDIGSGFGPSETGLEVMRQDLERCQALAARYPGEIAESLAWVIDELSVALEED